MSGSGGYYKYRCKYFFTYNCPNWVWVNNSPCAHCLADGRDDDTVMAPPFRISREIYVPQLENGSLHYIMMEIIAASDFDSGWGVKVVPPRPSPAFPNSTAPSTVPAIPSLKATAGIEVPNTQAGLQPSAQSWAGAADHME